MNESAELSAAAADARIIPSLRDTDESWRRCCRRLRAELGENVFTSWFGCLKLDSPPDRRDLFETFLGHPLDAPQIELGLRDSPRPVLAKTQVSAVVTVTVCLQFRLPHKDNELKFGGTF